MSNVRVLMVSTSLRPGSNSAKLAVETESRLNARGIESELFYLNDLNLPFCTGQKSDQQHSGVKKWHAALRRCSHLIFAVPIYNGDVNGAARNLINLGGDWSHKTVGFLCAAGGEKSYMAVYSLGNSLMFEYECWIAPRFVYAVGADFGGQHISNPEILTRIDRLLDNLLERQPRSELRCLVTSA